MSWWNKGKSDASQNKGPMDPNKFPSSEARKQYDAGTKQGKQDNNNNKKK